MSLRGLERKTFSAGSPIIQQGEAARTAFVVDSGRVEIWVNAGGKRKVLAEVSTGGIFGEMALIDNSPRSANATAAEDTVCFLISDKTIQDKLEKADPLIRGLLRVLVRNVRAADGKLAPVE